MSEEEGMKSKKEDFREWFSEVVLKAELIEHSKVSGCMVFRPWAYFIWEQVRKNFDKKIKKLGVDNVYFPLFIPESVIKKEKEHIEGFAPEVAWVTHGGSSEFDERLAIRPTSETVMYDTFSKWVRSYRDLPLKVNQWCNIVRWEFKHPFPFLRTREFLWQEGHTVHSTKEDVDKEVFKVLDLYEKTFEELYAVPSIKGRKIESEKFAGAHSTYSVECILPNGKTIQAGTTHNLGQGFAKAFDITYLDENEEEKYPWQASWGISTRSIGVAIIAHGDDKGLVLPPAIAKYQAVIVPIYKEENKEKILNEARKLENSLKNIRVFLDESDKSPGWKFNHWELKGVPLRIEIGPRDIKKQQVVIVKRNTGEKKPVKLNNLDVLRLLKEVHEELYAKAEEVMMSKIKKVNNKKELYDAINNGFVAKSCWCGDDSHQDGLKKELGAKSVNMPFGEELFNDSCAFCKKKAKYVVLWAKQY